MSEAQQPETTRQPLGGGRAQGNRTQAGSRLDRWVGSYASRTRGMTASEIRALFAVASRPEVVSLAGGMPFLPALPLDVVGEALASSSPSAARWRCSTAPVRATPACATRSST